MSNERLVRNAALPAKQHVSAETVYAEERITCTCGEVVTAEPDQAKRDQHAPLIAAWEAHRREHGLAKGSGRGHWARGAA